MGGLPLAQVPSLSGRGCLSLALDSGYLRPLSVSAARAGSATFRGGPGCHPTGLGGAPRGRLVSGLEKLVFLPSPPPLPPYQPGVLGEGVSRNWWFPTFHTGWEWEGNPGGGEHRRGGSGIGIGQELLWPVRLNLLVGAFLIDCRNRRTRMPGWLSD